MGLLQQQRQQQQQQQQQRRQRQWHNHDGQRRVPTEGRTEGGARQPMLTVGVLKVGAIDPATGTRKFTALRSSVATLPVTLSAQGTTAAVPPVSVLADEVSTYTPAYRQQHGLGHEADVLEATGGLADMDTDL